MEKQIFRPIKGGGEKVSYSISDMGLEHPQGIVRPVGRGWMKHHVCRQDSFSLVINDCYFPEHDDVRYSNQEDYIKINLWLSGKHTTVLDGFGQHEHDGPEVFITCLPQEKVKVDILRRDTHITCVHLCLRSSFFQTHLGLAPDALPEPLCAMALAEAKPFAFVRLPLTRDLSIAARAVLAAPFAVCRDPIYGRAKSVELMCLLINSIESSKANAASGKPSLRLQETRLYRARDLLTHHYAQPITLEEISKAVGLNRMALCTGFRRLFGISVYDYLQQMRMERALELLQDHNYTVTRAAEAVGFEHSCNFSTAFRQYYGYPPRKVRGALQS